MLLKGIFTEEYAICFLVFLIDFRLMEIVLLIVAQDKTMQDDFQAVLSCLFLLPLL